jgi:hypothetical protein
MNVVVGLASFIAGLLVGGAAIAAVIWLSTRMRLPRTLDRGRARAALEMAAEQLSWARLGPDDEPVLLLERRGYAGRVEYRSGRRAGTDVTFDTGGGVNGWLQVAPESVAHGMIKTFGVADMSTGDGDFDNAHEISASNETFARRLLDDDGRSMLRSVGVHGDFVFRVTPNSLLLRVERHVYDARAIEGLVVIASNLFGALDLPEKGRIEVSAVENRVSPSATCEICGASLSIGSVVRCSKCRTPHHRDCWDFNGCCSTFACGSRERA